MKNSLVGAGGCIQNNTGNWICGFSKFCGYGTSLQLELWAIMTGLSLVLDNHCYTNLIVKTDSQQALDLLSNNSTALHPQDSIIINCRYLLSKIKDHTIVKIGRQQNKVVDALAKMGTQNKMPLTIFQSIPLNIL